MKKILLVLVAVLLLTGCGNKLSELPKDPVSYQIGTIKSKDKKESYTALIHDGKYFIAFGNLKSGFMGDFTYAFGDCLGYVAGEQDLRVYELKGSSKDEWLIEYQINGEMSQPIVFKEAGADNAKIPSSVEESKDNYFNQK